MPPRLLGYLSDRHLALYEIRPSGWQLLREFAESEAAELPAYLHRDRPLHLLADLVEMEFRYEKIPCVRGSDRQALLQRKLQQAFRTSTFRHAASIGREPGRNGQERLLLSAVSNPEALQAWLAPLREHHLPLAGIASLPILQQRLAASLAGEESRLLLLTVQRRGGIRLSYFHDRELRFSRLAAHSETSGTLGEAALEEAVRTRQYLLGLHLLERDKPLAVICLLPETEIADMKAAHPAVEGLEFRHVGLADAARRAGLKAAPAARSGEDLCIALLLESRFPNHFAPASERRSFYLYRLRRALLAGSGLLALGALAASGALLAGLPEQRQALRSASADAAALSAEVDQRRASFPRTGVPVEEIREALGLAHRLAAENAPSRRLLADISRGFDTVPQAELNRLTWLRSDQPPPLPAAPDGRPGRMHWLAIVNGDIVGIGDYRKANAMTNALSEAIRRDDVEVEILRYPFDVRPNAEVLDNFGKPPAGRLPFTLRVTWNE